MEMNDRRAEMAETSVRFRSPKFEPSPITTSMVGPIGYPSTAMFGLTNGELFVVVFLVVMVVSAPWWPKAGEAVFSLLSGKGRPREPRR
jgi:hypothetical protein